MQGVTTSCRTSFLAFEGWTSRNWNQYHFLFSFERTAWSWILILWLPLLSLMGSLYLRLAWISHQKHVQRVQVAVKLVNSYMGWFAPEISGDWLHEDAGTDSGLTPTLHLQRFLHQAPARLLWLRLATLWTIWCVWIWIVQRQEMHLWWINMDLFLQAWAESLEKHGLLPWSA